MASKLVALLILLTSSRFSLGRELDWDDKDTQIASLSISGQKQSPIDLNPDIIRNYPIVDFLNYNSLPEEVVIKNDGDTVKITGTWNNIPTIELYETEFYRFENAHLHWSENDEDGTEHSIQGKKYAAELHLVHLNSKYQTLEDVLEQADGICVLSILFEVNDQESPNRGMVAFAELAKRVIAPFDMNIIGSFNLSTFLPNTIRSYYSYSGSLTTPPYSENVRWIVLAQPQPINSRQIDTFRRVQLKNGETSNTRPLQENNGRLVELYTF